jgi:hypothetical protein
MVAVLFFYFLLGVLVEWQSSQAKNQDSEEYETEDGNGGEDQWYLYENTTYPMGIGGVGVPYANVGRSKARTPITRKYWIRWAGKSRSRERIARARGWYDGDKYSLPSSQVRAVSPCPLASWAWVQKGHGLQGLHMGFSSPLVPLLEIELTSLCG